ncbi:MAG TPA: YdcH family protein [Polyangiaceae bacterium]|nr:YdcH family protein [Polyangiaceae bacterium]
MKHMDVYELELRHQALDAQIHKLDRRGAHMTPEDRQRAAELKKRRLETKDRIYAIRAR